MKTIFTIAGFLSVMIFVHSCSSHAYVQKEDSISLSDYKTYMWVDTRANESDQSKSKTDFADNSIHDAAKEELDQLGWKEVKENPDVLMSYEVLVERSFELKQEAVYTQPVTRYYYNPNSRKWSTIYYPSQFQGYQVYETPVKEGTITITMVDAKTDMNILQGWTTERLTNAGITETEIRRSIKNIFRELS